MSNEKSSHGILIAIEKDGDAGGTFTVIANQTNDQEFEMSRPWTDVTPHNDKIDSGVVGVMQRAPITVAGSFVYNEATHDHSTGLQKRYDDGDLFGIQWRGKDFAADTDEIIGSCHVISFKRMGPNREGVYGFEAVLRLSGQMEIDGVVYGD